MKKLISPISSQINNFPLRRKSSAGFTPPTLITTNTGKTIKTESTNLAKANPEAVFGEIPRTASSGLANHQLTKKPKEAASKARLIPKLFSAKSRELPAAV